MAQAPEAEYSFGVGAVVQDTAPTVFVVDDDPAMRESLHLLVQSDGFLVVSYATAEEFLEADNLSSPGCMLLDVRMPGMNGLELQERLRDRQILLPLIMITGYGDVAMAVQAVKKGAFDFIEKPYDVQVLLDSMSRAIEWDAENRRHRAEAAAAAARLGQLTPRECEVLQFLAAGYSLRETGHELSRSVHTINRHTSNMMTKLGVHSRVQLVCLAIRGGIVQP